MSECQGLNLTTTLDNNLTTLQAKKERFLSHPLIEAYLKLKWFATWRIYVFFLLLHVAYLLSIIGFAYVQFSGDQYISNPMTREGRTANEMEIAMRFLSTNNYHVLILGGG